MTLQRVSSGLLVIVLIVGLAYKGYEEYKVSQQADDNSIVQDDQVLGGLEIGRKAPDFSLETLDGRLVTLGEFEGQQIVLNFWASWCPPCREEFPELMTFAQKTSIPVIGINMTKNERRGKEDVEAFMNQMPVTFPILLDESATAEQAYRIVALPTTYVIDAKGIITAKHTGPVDEAWLIKHTTRSSIE